MRSYNTMFSRQSSQYICDNLNTKTQTAITVKSYETIFKSIRFRLPQYTYTYTRKISSIHRTLVRANLYSYESPRHI